VLDVSAANSNREHNLLAVETNEQDSGSENALN